MADKDDAQAATEDLEPRDDEADELHGGSTKLDARDVRSVSSGVKATVADRASVKRVAATRDAAIKSRSLRDGML